MSPPPGNSAPARYRALIVDDEPAGRRSVRRLLEEDAEVEIVGEAASGPHAVETVARLRPDLIFLDVQMPAMDGFEVLAQLGDRARLAVVLVTADGGQALRAFEVNAADCLLKPFADERFRSAVARAKAAARRHWPGENPGPRAPPAAGHAGRILLKSGGEIFFLKADEIDWIEAEGDYVKFHVTGKIHLLRGTMARLEQRLDPHRFARIHRSTIVNLDRVRKLSPAFAGDYAVTLHDGVRLGLSRGYRDRLRQLLSHPL